MIKISSVFLLATVVSLFSIPAVAEVRFIPVQHLVDDTWSIGAGTCREVSMNLDADAKLYGSYQVQGVVDNRLGVELVDGWNFRLRAAGQPYQHYVDMSGTVAGAATLKFQVPSAGQYFALFCNDKALVLDRLAHVDLYTTHTQLNSDEEALRVDLEKTVSVIHEIFVLPDFDVTVAPCGVVNAFSNPNITLCTEIIESFPRSDTGDLLAFVLFHELGHTALRLWGLPGWDNEDTADEFASAFLLMAKKKIAVTTAANWWLSQSGNSRAEALSKIGIDDRHSLTIQRARNIHRWAENESELTQRWMTLFASHLTPSALKGVAQDERFADNEAIKTAIGRRDEKPVVPAVSRGKDESVSDAPAGSLTQRLQDLKAAKDAGLITEAEFKRKRAKVLAE